MNGFEVDHGELRSIARLYDGIADDLAAAQQPVAPDAGESTAVVADALGRAEAAGADLAACLHALAAKVNHAVDLYEATDHVQAGTLGGIVSAGIS
jgi:uncharacterized protein YukE